MNINLLDWFGYLASVVILISLTMSSIIKLRWINLVGAIMFSIFGFMIGSMPTGFLNLGIVFIDIYYLYLLYNRKEDFAVVEADMNSEYFKRFISLNEEEIRENYDLSNLEDEKNAYYFLRNNAIAGVLVGRSIGEDIFFIEMDFVSKEYRDFKIANHFLGENKIGLLLKGYKELRTIAKTKLHSDYLEKIGFVKSEDGIYKKSI